LYQVPRSSTPRTSIQPDFALTDKGYAFAVFYERNSKPPTTLGAVLLDLDPVAQF